MALFDKKYKLKKKKLSQIPIDNVNGNPNKYLLS